MSLTALDLSILRHLSHSKPQTCFAVAKSLSGNPDPNGMESTVRYRLRKLQDHGLVVRSSNGTVEYWGITDKVRFGKAHLSVHTKAGIFNVDYGDTVIVQYRDRCEVVQFSTNS